MTNGLNTHFKAAQIYKFSYMRPNIEREGRDPGQLGQCHNFHRLLACLTYYIGEKRKKIKGNGPLSPAAGLMTNRQLTPGPWFSTSSIINMFSSYSLQD